MSDARKNVALAETPLVAIFSRMRSEGFSFNLGVWG